MSKNTKSDQIKAVYRIIDANTNRAKEGLRVCEEVTRFILNSRSLTARIKEVRHQLHLAIKKLQVNKLSLLEQRDILEDVGKPTTLKERVRKNFKDIFFANIQRTKESLRVLEEFSKLISKGSSDQLKSIRYTVYDIEKKVIKKI